MLYLLYSFFKFLGDDVGVGSFQHHRDSAYTLAFTVHCHGTETFGRAETDYAYIADMYRNPVPVGYNDAFDVLRPGYHTFRPDIIGVICFFNVASACVLVVAAEGFEHFADGDVQ